MQSSSEKNVHVWVHLDVNLHIVQKQLCQFNAFEPIQSNRPFLGSHFVSHLVSQCEFHTLVFFTSTAISVRGYGLRIDKCDWGCFNDMIPSLL